MKEERKTETGKEVVDYMIKRRQEIQNTLHYINSKLHLEPSI